jgi:hypothetical protein
VVVSDSSRRKGEESARSEHLVIVRTKGGYTLALVLQRGLVESAISLILQEKVGGHIYILCFSFYILFEQFTFEHLYS